MTSSSGSAQRHAVLLFTDIAGSTALKTRLGDVRYAEEIARPHNALFREILGSIAGAEENNYTGDGFLATFVRVSDAVVAALRFQHAMRTHRWTVEAPRVRIAVHVGEVVLLEGKPGAQPVIASQAADLCARLLGLAREGQILLTRHAFDDARQYVRDHPAVSGEDGPPLLRWIAHGRYRFKGRDDDPMEVFEVGAQGEAPLKAPGDSEKARRFVDADEEELLGWRPGVGLPVPGREGWVLERQLGIGGFGEVWLARQEPTKTQRVMKFCFDADRVRSFRRELALFRLLRDALGDRPDIAKLHDVQLDRPVYRLESEFTRDGDLRSWSSARGGIASLPLDVRLDLVARTAVAVSAAHSVGVLHKDLKPTNILICTAEDGSPRPRLSDFGIGSLTDPGILRDHGITMAGFTVMTREESSRSGTLMYAPPEQIAGRPFTMQGDVYALGVILYQMVVGDLDRPLAPGWERDLDAAVGDPTARALLRGDLAAMIDGDPSRRLASAAEVSARIRSLGERRAAAERAKAEEQSRAAAERRAAEADARRRRTLRVAGGVVAGLALLVIVAAVFLKRERGLRETADRERARAQDQQARAQRLAELMLHEVYDGLEPLGRLELLGRVARAALRYYDSLPEQDLSPEELRSRVVALGHIGDVLRGTGDTGGAAGAYREAVAVARRLAAADPNSVAPQRDLCLSLWRMGDLERDRGDLKPARDAYRESYDICRRVTSQVPQDATTQRDLSASIGSLAAVEKERGDVESALRGYREALGIARRLAENDSDNATLQHDVSVDLVSVGEVEAETGQLEAASRSYRESLDIARRIASRDPGNLSLQRHLSVTMNHLGDVLDLLGEGADALARYQEAHGIARRLAGQDPANASWQRDLAVSFNRLGDHECSRGARAAALPHYEEALAIRRRLAAMDHDNAVWQRDLAVTLERAGDALGGGDPALERYRESLGIARRLVERDASNGLWQRGLALVLMKLGLAERDARLLDAAVEHLSEALAVCRNIVEGDPGDLRAQRDLAASLLNLGTTLPRLKRDADAVAALDEAEQIHRRLVERMPHVAKEHAQFTGAQRWMSLVTGARPPESPADHLEVAYTLEQRKDHVGAARHFELALADAGNRADMDDRYNAACAAALASAAGESAEGRRWRQLAMEWLAEDLKARRGLLAEVKAKLGAREAPAEPRSQLEREQDALQKHIEWARTGDPDLASLRRTPEFEALFPE